MIEINAKGLGCPMPVVKTMEAIKGNPRKPIIVTVDAEVAKENILRLARNNNLAASTEEIAEGEYRITLKP